MNDENFKGISWTESQSDDGMQLVMFKGTSKTLSDECQLTIVFGKVGDDSKPVVVSLETDSNEESSEISIQKYLDKGMELDQAMVMMDTAAAIWVSLMMTGTIDNESDLSLPHSNTSKYDNYNDVVEEYLSAANMNKEEFNEAYDFGKDCSSINALIMSYYHKYGNISIGYTFYDIDYNNTQELIVSDMNSIIDIYTIDGGKAVKLFEDCDFGDRNKLYLLSHGRMLFEGSISAFSSCCEIYRMSEDGTSVIAEDRYYYNSNGRDADMDETYTYMSMDEYSDMTAEWIGEAIFSSLAWEDIMSYNGSISMY